MLRRLTPRPSPIPAFHAASAVEAATTTALPESVGVLLAVNGRKQRALFGWNGHLCTANGPSAKAMGTHGPIDPAAPEGRPRKHTGHAEGCLPEMRRSESLTFLGPGHGPVEPAPLGETRPSQRGSNGVRTLLRKAICLRITSGPLIIRLLLRHC